MQTWAPAKALRGGPHSSLRGAGRRQQPSQSTDGKTEAKRVKTSHVAFGLLLLCDLRHRRAYY